jgi:hypothetical protein
MKNKYSITKACLFCGNNFETRPRFTQYCSQPCKNPSNRPGNIPWNKGITLTDEQKAKQNTDGLKKGRGWNKGLSNERQREKWLYDNPNKDGKLNNLRPKDPNIPAYKKYLGQVRRATYRTIKDMKKNNEWVPVTGKHKTDYQIDHIIPCKQGFDLGIKASLLGSRNNIQFIRGDENRKKWHSYQTDEVVKSILGDKYVL